MKKENDGCFCKEEEENLTEFVRNRLQIKEKQICRLFDTTDKFAKKLRYGHHYGRNGLRVHDNEVVNFI